MLAVCLLRQKPAGGGDGQQTLVLLCGILLMSIIHIKCAPGLPLRFQYCLMHLNITAKVSVGCAASYSTNLQGRCVFPKSRLWCPTGSSCTKSYGAGSGVGEGGGGRCVCCHHFMKLPVVRIPLTYNYSELAENERPGTTHPVLSQLGFDLCHILKVTWGQSGVGVTAKFCLLFWEVWLNLYSGVEGCSWGWPAFVRSLSIPQASVWGWASYYFKGYLFLHV